MNKHITLLAAGALLALAACNNGKDTGPGAMTQAQIDSAVTARTAEQQDRIRRNNDSLVNAMAQMRADSMTNAGIQKQGTNAATVSGRQVQQTTKSVSHSTSHTGNTGGVKSTSTESTPPPTQTITTEQKKEQDNKFKER